MTTQIHDTSGNIGVEAELGWPVRVFTPGEPRSSVGAIGGPLVDTLYTRDALRSSHGDKP